MAKISVSDIYTDGFDVYISGLDTGYQFSDRTVAWYLNGSLDGYGDDLPANASRGGDYSFTGLRAGKKYTVKAVIEFTDHSGYKPVTLTKSITTEEEPIQIEPWNWDISNGSYTNGKAYLTTNSLKALTSRGPTTDFSYLVWNDLCEKISELR